MEPSAKNSLKRTPAYFRNLLSFTRLHTKAQQETEVTGVTFVRPFYASAEVRHEQSLFKQSATALQVRKRIKTKWKIWRL